MRRRVITMAAVVGSLLVGCVLGLYGTSAAQNAPTPTIRPFANSQGSRVDTVELLQQVVNELKQQNKLLKEQNAFLKSGELKVKTN
ncbi:MAG: hypothetical protein JW818_08890 [Pirellulales bacterium]|nr:hypothetical protein [Pirellulales bacterium]